MWGPVKGNSPRKVWVVGWREWEWPRPRPPQPMRSLQVRGWGCGETPRGPRGRGPGPFFGAGPSEGRRRRRAAAGRRWKPSWASCAEPRALLLSTGELCVRLPSTSSPEGKVVGPAPLVRMPFGDPLSLRGRRRRLGVRSGVTWLLGRQG